MLDQNKENQLNNWLEQSVLNNRIPFGEISISKENKNIYKYKIYTQDEKYKNNKQYIIIFGLHQKAPKAKINF